MTEEEHPIPDGSWAAWRACASYDSRTKSFAIHIDWKDEDGEEAMTEHVMSMADGAAFLAMYKAASEVHMHEGQIMCFIDGPGEGPEVEGEA